MLLAKEVYGSKHCPLGLGPEAINRCVVDNTVVVTSFDSRFASLGVRLAKSAAEVGFPCTIVFAQEDVQDLCDPAVVPVLLQDSFSMM